ncbi:MAG: CPBP family intramembrane metalloprotease [Thermoplasmata archaeon]|nr:CPBP family intramembrane metalloprotease [Thermoplasmata archaeon]
MTANEDSTSTSDHHGVLQAILSLGFLPWFFLLLVIVGEIFVSYVSLTMGLVFHGFLVFLLVIVAAMVYTKNPLLSNLLAVLILAPIIRVLSLSTPLWPFTETLYWLFVISFPLLAATFATMSVQRLKREDVGLVLGDKRKLWIQVLVVLVGAPLGVVEFLILAPDPWIPAITLQNVMMGVVIIFVGTGLAEELIFRGVMQHSSERVMSEKWALVFVALVFTALHISFLSLTDLGFVFFVAILFGITVQKTGTIVGVIGAHTLLNSMLYLVMPFFF